MRISGICGLLVLVVFGSGGCQTAGHHTRQGTLAGGLAGGAVGTLAGASRGKPLEGALIGAAAGSTLGGALGNSVDQEVAAEQAAIMHDRSQRMSEAISVPQAIEMTRAGLDEQVIVNQIHAYGVPARLTTHDLIMLKNAGVSSNVISAMQTARLATQPASRVPGPMPREVIVQEHWVSPPPFYYPPPRYYHAWPPPYRRPSHRGWGLSVSF